MNASVDPIEVVPRLRPVPLVRETIDPQGTRETPRAENAATTDSASAVELENVFKSFGEKAVLRGVNLKVPRRKTKKR